jgi:hypothetical protein
MIANTTLMNPIDSLLQEQLPPIGPEEAEELRLSEAQKALQPDINIGTINTRNNSSFCSL